MAHKHSVYDTDTHFIINPITREIKNDSSTKTRLMQKDHNSERYSFELQREIEAHDMSLCDAIKIHYINTETSTKESNYGIYEADDLEISEDGSTIVFTWLITDNATQKVGPLSFRITFECTTEGSVDYRWSTNIYSAILVSDGIDNSEAIMSEYADVLVKWKKEVLENINPMVTIDTELNEESDNAIANSTVAKKISQLSEDKADKVHTHEDYATKDDLSNVSVSEEQIEQVVENYLEENPVEVDLSGKQDTLVSGTNIKTINGNSLLGSGNIAIEGGSGGSSETWEEIINVKLEEEVTYILHELETPTAFKKIYLYFSLVGTDTNQASSGVTLNANTTSQWIGGADSLYFRAGLFGKTSLKRSVLIEFTPFVVQTLETSHVDVATNELANSLWSKATSSFNGSTIIHTLQFGTQNRGNVFGVGSEIKIYGVRV